MRYTSKVLRWVHASLTIALPTQGSALGTGVFHVLRWAHVSLLPEAQGLLTAPRKDEEPLTLIA